MKTTAELRSSHFDGGSLAGKSKIKQQAAIRVDYLVSIAKLARAVSYHNPKLVIGLGQGALVALGFARPYVLELVLQTRNVQQRQEAQQIGEAWGAVAGIISIDPRMFKKGLVLDLFRLAMPEFFKTNCPVPSVRQFGLRNAKSSHYLADKEFYAELEVEILEGYDKAVLSVVVQSPARLMWDHDGQCTCGRRTYLFGQCMKCLAVDRQDAERERAQAEVEKEEDDTDDDKPIAKLLKSSAMQRLRLESIPARTTHSAAAIELIPMSKHTTYRDPASGSQEISPPVQDLRVAVTKSGSYSDCLCLITDYELGLLFARDLASKHMWPEGPMYIDDWHERQDFDLRWPTRAVKNDKYRISFVCDSAGILPLQQCVEVRREKAHRIDAGAFHRDPNAMLSQEYGIVGTLLDREVS